jgi:uncharacterized Zn finger protein
LPDKDFLSQGLWFKPQSLQPMVNDATWERGLMLYRAKKVVALEIEPVRLHWQLLGEVQGTQRLPYEVSVEMALMPDGEVDFWESDCNCPVGSQCKHGVALMLEAADQGLKLLEESGIASAVSDLLTPPNAEQLEVAVNKPKPSYCAGCKRWTTPAASPCPHLPEALPVNGLTSFCTCSASLAPTAPRRSW